MLSDAEARAEAEAEAEAKAEAEAEARAKAEAEAKAVAEAKVEAEARAKAVAEKAAAEKAAAEKAAAEKAAAEMAAAAERAETEAAIKAVAEAEAEEAARAAEEAARAAAALAAAEAETARLPQGGAAAGRGGRGGRSGRGGRGGRGGESLRGQTRKAEAEAGSPPQVAAVSLADARFDTGRHAAPESTLGGETTCIVCFAKPKTPWPCARRGAVRPPERVRRLLGPVERVPHLPQGGGDVDARARCLNDKGKAKGWWRSGWKASGLCICFCNRDRKLLLCVIPR
jgi:hypothetical protein